MGRNSRFTRTAGTVTVQKSIHNLDNSKTCETVFCLQLKSSASMNAAFFYALLLVFFVSEGYVCANKCAKKLESTAATAKASTYTGPKRWAIVALAKPGKEDINKRNQLLAEKLRPYASKHNLTVVVFSEKIFPPASIASWKTTFKGVANVAYVNTAERGFHGVERFGYKYMCKFFSLDIYDYLKDSYDYYMRCDTDCYIQTLGYDILKWAEDSNVGYGFAMRKLEAHKPTAATLPAWSASYMQECGITAPAAVMDQPFDVCFNFYNNWHIGQVSFFTRSDVQHYLRTVNASGYILSHRWGDSTIQAYAVRMFMDPKQIQQVPEFRYIHGSHGNKMVSTFGTGAETNVPQRLPNWKYTGSK
jgi:hypothetical protein